MKEINNKILDDFLAKNHQRCHSLFMGSVFQDICGRIFVNSAYSRFLNERGPTSGQNSHQEVELPQKND